ncbi:MULTISPECIES: hypothetical protein [Pseudonocardia]|uniref:Uncharacterized protein n=2 Tax=Pseudonocardia TaxID=1847 RepID=A0A1Y2MLC9_PSEAH|nr:MULTISPECIES: hypothetical protein [Pseudonocardia]OSY36083.1 hypothetical protein BG845_05598 [Pseudonocardia autotrophica]TDN77564.1 hypothetical protein C8E95_6813 [Pseudonocardia autotrophica]BBG01593.1 hypothetical protein Pdca_28020 [Pseudonocardia autotrophica]GEC25338.1 hypothetical protein PSA01_23670 [Pseudonocardia saturnea]
MSSVATTQPITIPHRNHHVGDRVTYWCTDTPDGVPLRLVGDVTSTASWTFTVTWDGGHGTARFAHNHEPDTLRPATPADERDALTLTVRATVAADYRRTLAAHPHWPDNIRNVLDQRATDLLGPRR